MRVGVLLEAELLLLVLLVDRRDSLATVVAALLALLVFSPVLAEAFFSVPPVLVTLLIDSFLQTYKCVVQNWVIPNDSTLYMGL